MRPAAHPKTERLHLVAIALAAVALSGSSLSATSEGKPMNVLMVAIDDLNDWVGFLGGHPQTKTPNLDRLAEQKPKSVRPAGRTTKPAALGKRRRLIA